MLRPLTCWRGFQVSYEGSELSFQRPEEFGHEVCFDYALETLLDDRLR